MICNNTGEYLAFHADVETEGSIVRRDTTEPLVRRGPVIDLWWVKTALKYAQRRAYWMNIAHKTSDKFTRQRAVKHARSSNRDVLWAIRGARKWGGWHS
jgi:hypothetical protein